MADVSFRFGDVDGDGVNDEQELQDGTNPHDANNYAVNLFVRFEGVFHTTNMLSVALQTASEVLYGPVSLMNGTTWTFSSNRVEVTSGGRPSFVFWDDANSNDSINGKGMTPTCIRSLRLI